MLVRMGEAVEPKGRRPRVRKRKITLLVSVTYLVLERHTLLDLGARPLLSKRGAARTRTLPLLLHLLHITRQGRGRYPLLEARLKVQPAHLCRAGTSTLFSRSSSRGKERSAEDVVLVLVLVVLVVVDRKVQTFFPLSLASRLHVSVQNSARTC